MPSHEDTCNELYYLDSHGNFVPLKGISEMKVCEDVKAYHNNPLLSSTEAEMTFTLTWQSEKRLRKMIRKIKNHFMREKRTAIRRKEKLRRLSLKADGILREV